MLEKVECRPETTPSSMSLRPSLQATKQMGTRRLSRDRLTEALVAVYWTGSEGGVGRVTAVASKPLALICFLRNSSSTSWPDFSHKEMVFDSRLSATSATASMRRMVLSTPCTQKEHTMPSTEMTMSAGTPLSGPVGRPGAGEEWA